MSKTARQYGIVQPESVQSDIPQYRVGLYARLSNDRDTRKNESIDNQIDVMKAYIKERNYDKEKKSEFMVYDVYSDLGKTGTNYDRPEFERLMSDAKSRKINCIMVKDFSRLGRNYIETGDYIEKIFPFLGVRFISVADKFDSDSTKISHEKLVMNIKNLVNDMYAKDISKKIRAVVHTAQERGEYVGSLAPYGYKVDRTGDIVHLVVDEETATIVRFIFNEYVSGKGIQYVIDKLYEKKVHRISDYKKYKHVYQQPGEILHQWGSSSIRAVLKRNNYYGDLVQHRYESRFPKGEKGCEETSPDTWIIKKNAHEAIISRETFEKARMLLKEQEDKKANSLKKRKKAEKYEAFENIFKNVLYCGDCGRKMSGCYYQKESGERNYYYYCYAYQYKDERKCIKKSITEEYLISTVKEKIRQELKALGIRGKDLTLQNKQIVLEYKNKYEKDIRELEKKNEQKVEFLSELFIQYKEGNIGKEEYVKAKKECEAQEKIRIQLIEEIKNKLKKLPVRAEEENKFLRSLLKAKSTKKLNVEIIDALFDRINFYGDGRLEIVFKIKLEGDDANE